MKYGLHYKSEISPKKYQSLTKSRKFLYKSEFKLPSNNLSKLLEHQNNRTKASLPDLFHKVTPTVFIL